MNTIDRDRPIYEAIAQVIQDFQVNAQAYFTEEDVRWQVIKEIEARLSSQNQRKVQLRDGYTSCVHGEYPSPFRCSMAAHSFSLEDIESSASRGHFDVVVLNPAAALQCSFEIARAQYYHAFLGELSHLPLPFLDCVIEIKLFRDLAHRNRTESPGAQAKYGMQAINKVVAALDAQPPYYFHPFARRGVVLMLDNSHLAYSTDILGARQRFINAFENALDCSLLPNTFLAVWATPDEKREYRGTRAPHTS
ncbi:MAG: hypothetical protein R6U93_08710 [Dehalococcoidia bacterium]